MLCSVVFCVFSKTQNYKIQHYTTDDGLAQNYVECIFKDSRDFMWFGTWYGLNRFDGYNFVTYREKFGENSISSDFVNDIVEDKNGDLWIATRQGLTKFDFDIEKFIHFDTDTTNYGKSISDSWITTLLFDDEDNLWIGTESEGVNCISFNDDLSRVDTIRNIPIGFNDPYGISDGTIYSMLKSSDGYIYIGTSLGLDRLNPKNGEVYKFQDLLNPLNFHATIVHSLFEDKDKTIWIGTEDGLIRKDQNAQKLKVYEVDKFRETGLTHKTLQHGLVRSIDQDNSGTMVIGTLGGLHLFDKETESFTVLPVNKEKEESLNNEFINEVYCDSTGNVWIGTAKGGVNKYNTNQKEFNYVCVDPNNPNDISHSIINSLYEDDKQLWIGSAGKGLYCWDKKSENLKEYRHIPEKRTSINSNFITSIISGVKPNEMWFGTWGRGINQSTTQANGDLNFETLIYNPTVPYGEPNIYVSCLLKDKQGFIWIATTMGLYVYDAANDDYILVEKPSRYGEIITAIGTLYLDCDNNLWIGTTNGLNRIKINPEDDIRQRAQPDSIFTYTATANDEQSLSGNFVVTIYQDATKQLWVSTFGKGLNKLENLSADGKTACFSHYKVEDGLSSGVVYGILEDEDNNLWLSTDQGITCYNYKSENSIRYYESDGLRSDQFYWSASLKGLDSTLYFGSSKGLIYFNPLHIKQNPYKPHVVITDLKLFNKSVAVTDNGDDIISKMISEVKEVNLEYDENIISFEFSALSYFSPKNNQYQYRLEGFDKEWVTCSSDRRFATYTNLNPGVYLFEVKGSNNDGLWSDESAKLKLIIRQPWWKTELFIFGMFIFITWLTWLFVVIRNRQLNRKKEMLEKLVLQRTKALKEKSEALEKQTSQLNMSNKQLSRSNETKDKLFAIIAHDLKSPFNVILSVSELLHENYDDLDDISVKKMLRTIHKSSNNFYMLLENLLEWTKVQRDDLKVNARQVDLKEVIDLNILVFEDQAKEKEILVNCEYNSLATIRADENMLNTIFRNLINNAIKFTSNGKVAISVTDLDKKNVLVEVKDSGVGITIEQLENLFVIKEVASTRGTNGEKGTGLGLVVCKEFVEISGGRIWVKSQCGKGTSFYFTLPVE